MPKAVVDIDGRGPVPCRRALSVISGGVAGIHLEVDINNQRAIGFYGHLGFETLMIEADVRFMGMLTAP